MKEKTIDYRFKILYAVGMIMVVSGHCGGGGIELDIAGWFPYEGLHLALFVFCSGYFYKKEYEGNVRKYIFKKVKTLIIPLYIYTIIYGLFVQISHIKNFEMGDAFNWHNILVAPIINGHQFIYNMGGWFIAPLFMVEIYNILLRKLFRIIKLNIPEWIFFIINISLGLIGNTLACNGYYLDGWLALVRMLYFIPFYGLGIFYKNVVETYEKKIPGIYYFSAIFLIKLVIYCYYGKSLVYSPSWCQNFTEGPVMPILVGYIGIAFWMRMATILEPILGRNKYVNLIADNTYSIMMNQFLGFMIVKTVFALFSKFTPLFSDFDWVSYKTNIWWYYAPGGILQTKILYLIMGIAFPILVQLGINKIKPLSYCLVRKTVKATEKS